jgi:nucleoside-diphosphate-sugar epimerase
MTICIIGAGFIGKNYATFLAKKKKVYLISKTKTKLKLKNVINYKLTYTKNSFYNFFKNKKIKKIFFFSGVPHPKFCVQYPNKIFKIETKVIINILESLKKINYKGSFFLSSSCAVYSGARSKTKLFKETDELNLNSLYAKLKFLSERIAIFYSKKFKIKLIILRISSVYGFGLNRQVIFETFKKFIRNKKNIYVPGNGHESRDFLHINDLIKCLEILSRINNIYEKKQKLSYSIYNVGSGQITKIDKIIKLIKLLIKSQARINYSGIKNSYNPISLKPDISKLKKLKYVPYFNIKEGLSDTLLKLKKNYKLLERL